MVGNVPLAMADHTHGGHRVLRHGGPLETFVWWAWWANEPFVWWVSVSLEMVGGYGHRPANPVTVAYNYKVQGRTGRSKTGVEQPWGHTNNWHSN